MLFTIFYVASVLAIILLGAIASRDIDVEIFYDTSMCGREIGAETLIINRTGMGRELFMTVTGLADSLYGGYTESEFLLVPYKFLVIRAVIFITMLLVAFNN